MKILIGIVLIYAVCYLCAKEDHEKPKVDKIIFIDTLTKTEKSNTIGTSTTPETATVKDSVTEINNIFKKNVTENVTITNEGNSPNTSVFDNKYDILLRKHYYQLSDVLKEVNSYNCTEKSERSSLPESCEDYVECKNGKATRLQCLDGLHFDPKNADSEMPCQYSCDVPCTHNTPIESRYLTRECPLMFGYYKLEDKYNCSSFRICEFGNGYDFECPNGLAFRSDNLRCDWPHKVPECDAEGYAGFQCPDKNESYQFYRSPTSCQVYYICIYGVPRRQVCPNFTGFDEDSRFCAPADRVEDCDPHLKSAAKVDRRKQYLENGNNENYDDGDGYLAYRHADLSFARRVRKAKIISFPH